MMLRLCFVILIFLLFNSGVYSQAIVAGTVLDKISQKTVEFATIELLHLPDSAISKVTATDKRGKFSIADVSPGSYIVKCSFIGYDITLSQKFSVVSVQATHNIEPLELINYSKTLSDVTVVGRKTQLNASIDRKIYNVDQDIMSRSGTASDILRNVPSVEVDVEGNVSLRGSGDILILINGKPNPLMGRTRAEVLQQLPANSIERIEVITNPSARYRPDGVGGIINIVLKKNIKNGFNGTATVNAGNKDRYNGNLSLNYRPKKFNLFGSYSLRQDTRKRYNTVDRTYLDIANSSITSFFNQVTNSTAHPHGHIVTGGIDYTIDEKNSIGASATYFYRRQVRNDVTQNLSYNKQQILTQDFNRLRYDPEYEKQKNGTAYFQHSFGKDDHELRVEFNTSNEDEVEDNHYTTIYQLPANPKLLDNTVIKQGTRQHQLTVDYSNPLSEDSKLELGYDGLFNKNDLNFYGEYFDGAVNGFVKDLLKTNRFIYDENVHAIYATYQKGFEKFGYEIGLRTEAVFTSSHLVTLDSFVKNDYFKLYPTIHLSYKLKEKSELQLNYSKRINRPEGDELNPFPEYQDPRNLRAGNPKLLPEIIHSVEFGYKWQHKNFSFVPSIYYRYKVAGFTSVIVRVNDTTLLTTTQNLSNDQSAGLELILSAKAGKFFSAGLSTNFFYNKIDASNLGYIKNKSIYSATMNLNTNFNLTKSSILQLTGNYRSARLTPQGNIHPVIIVNTGMRQDLAKGKLSMTLTASDLFSSNRQRSELDIPYLKQSAVNKRDGLIVYFGISYRFGIIKKQKEEKLQFDNGG
jgi:outer membrane receptor protein involved in Fe transport